MLPSLVVDNEARELGVAKRCPLREIDGFRHKTRITLNYSSLQSLISSDFGVLEDGFAYWKAFWFVHLG